MPDSFIADLRADRDAIEGASGAQESRRQGGVEDTGVIEVGMRECSKAIQFLNAIMHNKYSNPEKLRAWKSATHLERAPERKKKDEPPKPNI